MSSDPPIDNGPASVADLEAQLIAASETILWKDGVIRNLQAERERKHARVEELAAICEALEAERDSLRETVGKRDDLLETAWGIIANAYGGDWGLASESSGWKDAAIRWRDEYHKTLPSASEQAAQEAEGGKE